MGHIDLTSSQGSPEGDERKTKKLDINTLELITKEYEIAENVELTSSDGSGLILVKGIKVSFSQPVHDDKLLTLRIYQDNRPIMYRFRKDLLPQIEVVDN